MKTCGIETQLARVDQNERDAIDVESIEVDEARIDSINTLSAICYDLPRWFRNHEGAPLANGDDWWADFYLDRHMIILPHVRSESCCA